MTRVRLASTPEERFIAHVDELQGLIDQLPNETVRAILAELATARQQILGELAGAEGFEAYRLRALEQRLQDVMRRFVEQYATAVSAPQLTMFEYGQRLAAEPLIRGGAMLHVPQVSRRELEVVQTFQAQLISGASADTVGAISTELRLGALRGASVPEVLAKVAGSLTEPGPFQSLAARAEAITRTELGRIQAIATHAGLTEAKTFVPDLRKQWLHSRNAGPFRRLGHLEADGQVRDVDATFRVRPVKGEPYELLMYPRAANATPRSSVNCGCSSAPFRESWSAAIAAARAEQAEFEASRRRAA